eukprot:333301_1
MTYKLRNNYHDHSGFNVCELYIEPKYLSFKEEITTYKYTNFKNYQTSITKVKMYQKSGIVKSMKADNNHAPQHYEIAYESPVTFDHLLAVVCYTDWTDFCYDFSSSFRRRILFETMQSVKTRNSSYYWMSRRLREVVELYGGYRAQWSGVECKGSFYCGVSTVMDIPSFSIRLCSPTSTSKHKEVAMRFAGKEGMILQFNNPHTVQYQYLRGFDCSWMSLYPEEGERLFFGGFFPIKLESVIIRKTLQNFEQIVSSLWYLDAMVSGGSAHEGYAGQAYEEMEANRGDILIIRNLINHVLNRKTSQTFDPFIYSTFYSFCQHKKQIILDLPQLCITADVQIVDLIMFPMDVSSVNGSNAQFVKSDIEEIEGSQQDFNCLSNLFRPELLEIFSNTKTIIMRTDHVHWMGDHQEEPLGWDTLLCAISLKRLLALIEPTNVQKVIVKSTDGHGYYNWIALLSRPSIKAITKEYTAKNYSISFNEFSILIFRK